MALDRPPIAAEIRATLAVAAPLAAANLAQMAMQVTNAVMVGHLGAVPLAAAGLGIALNATLLMTSQGLLTAVAPLAAHSIGAGDHPAAGRVAGGGLIVATAVAAPMMATPMVVPPLLSGLGYEPGLVAEIGRFLWAISWGIPGFLGAAVLRFLLIAVLLASPPPQCARLAAASTPVQRLGVHAVRDSLCMLRPPHSLYGSGRRLPSHRSGYAGDHWP
jgi:MATE family multidrug resistance protein